jgi:hypothetical protein
MRRRRFWRVVLGVLVSLALALVYAAWPGRSTFTVGPETTYVTGPLDAHGYVDYVTALNERLRGTITPEQNANVLIWRALGPRPEGGEMPPEYFTWLGIDPPPEQGDYLVSYTNYLKEHFKIDASLQREELFDRQSRAMKWPWRAADEPELADWLKRSEKPLALLVEASRRPDYYNPLVPNRTPDWSSGLLSSLLPNVQRCREVAAALTCRAMLRVQERKFDDAWRDLLACHRLGRLLSRGGSIIELLVGYAIEKIVSTAEVTFLDYAKLTSDQILARAADWRKLPPISTLAEKIDLTERFMMLDTMMLTMEQGTPFLESLSTDRRPTAKDRSARLFTRDLNWDPALRNAKTWYDRFAAALRLQDRGARETELADIIADIKDLRRQTGNPAAIGRALVGGPSARGERIGNILIALMTPAIEKVQGAADRCEQIQRNLHLAFALAAYRRDNGKYPAVLADLAPKYLDAIPDDLFSGEPLVYRPSEMGYLLYSVGPNGQDDGGQTWDDEPRGDDITVRVPVPEPRRKK